jgi:hypothetical protein
MHFLIITDAIFIRFSLQGKLNAAIEEERGNCHSNKEIYFLKYSPPAGSRGIDFVITQYKINERKSIVKGIYYVNILCLTLNVSCLGSVIPL